MDIINNDTVKSPRFHQFIKLKALPIILLAKYVAIYTVCSYICVYIATQLDILMGRKVVKVGKNS